MQEVFYLLLIGAFAGIISGAVGVGGGIIMVPMMVFVMGMTQMQAQGTSLAVMLPPTGLMAALMYWKQGCVNWKYALIIAFAFFFGAYFSSKIIVPRINIDNQHILRKAFAVLMLFVAVKLFFKK